MASLGDALAYPMERDDWVKTVVIGGVLTLFAFLLLPAWIVYGYVVRTIRDRSEGGQQPPAFEDWGSLLVEGLQAWIIGIVYMIIPAVVMVGTVGGAMVAIASGTRSGTVAGVGGLLGGLAISFVLSLVFGYFAIVGVVNFARKERFGAAFDLGVLRDVGFDGDYAIAWLAALVVLIVVGVVVGILNFIPFLGWIVGAFVYFYAVVVAANLWADGFAAAVD